MHEPKNNAADGRTQRKGEKKMAIRYLNPYIMDLRNYPFTDPRTMAAEDVEKQQAEIAALAKKVVDTGAMMRRTIPYKGMPMTEDLFAALFGIRFTIHSDGTKMAMFRSLSSSVLENLICLHRMANKDNVCFFCYSEGLSNYRKGLKANTLYNGRIFRNALIPQDCMPYLPYLFFRIESFGDAANVTHARNYLRLAKANGHCKIGCWTKNPGLYAMAIRHESRPENMSFGLSSRKLNTIEDVEKIARLFPFIDFIFTVFSLDYAAENNVTIMCGGRRCIDCRACYTAHERRDGRPLIVNELLKSDQTRAKSMFRARTADQYMQDFVDAMAARGVLKIA